MNSVAKTIHRRIEIVKSDIMHEIVNRFSNKFWSRVREDVEPDQDTMILCSDFLMLTNYNLQELSKVLENGKKDE